MKTTKLFFLILPCFLLIGNIHAQNNFTDSRDDEVYKTVKIGDQIWMAENLRYNSSDSYLNPDNPSKKYGRLYTWDASMKACPSGWHLPSDEEWKSLERYLGMSSKDANEIGGRSSGNVGKQLKSTSSWSKDEIGFAALPAGRAIGDSFGRFGENAYFWLATEESSDEAWYRGLDYDYNDVGRDSFDKSFGFSVRCLKD